MYPTESIPAWDIPASDLDLEPAAAALLDTELQSIVPAYTADDPFSAIDGGSLFTPDVSNTSAISHSTSWVDFLNLDFSQRFPRDVHCTSKGGESAVIQPGENAKTITRATTQLPGSGLPARATRFVNSMAFRSETGTNMSRKRIASPDEAEPQKQYLGSTGQIQGIQLKFRGTVQRASKRVKARVACDRCKRQKSKCENFRVNPYLPCMACGKMTTPKFLVNLCVLDAYLLDIRLFRLGPSRNNRAHPLSFREGHADVLSSTISDAAPESHRLELELTHQEIGEILPLTVSTYSPMPGDKLAYEGVGKNGRYRFEMPPYCITDVDKAKKSVFDYIEKTKAMYLNKLVDQNDKLLRTAFEHAINYPKLLVRNALSVWAATRLTEHTWYLHGDQTLGIDRSIPRNDPWNGFVPVTPIMDQQLDQMVIREYLMPRKTQLLDRISKMMANEKERLECWFEIALAVMILLNNAEMQLNGARAFSARYGLSGRYGPKGKCQNAEAQIHAGRTLLGHFHHAFRGGVILSEPAKTLAHIPLRAEDRKLLKQLHRVVTERKPEYDRLRFETRYEAGGYFVSQMFDKFWDGGTGYIKEDI